MFDLIIIGAGPGGISMAVEAISSGVSEDKILIIEKGSQHSWSIRKFYPEQKIVAANYKGKEAICTGAMCLSDTSKSEALSYLDKAILDYKINVNYHEEVNHIQKSDHDIFEVQTNQGSYKTKICVIAIGMMGRPNKPSFKIPSNMKNRVHYDITSTPIDHANVLVVGGGDTAAEYVQYLVEQNNTVALSYRRQSFTRLNQINLNAVQALAKKKKIQLILNSEIELLKEDQNNIKVIYKNLQEHPGHYDHIVLALGGTTPKNFLTLLGIDFVGEIPIIKDGYETSIPGLFLIGDLSAGKKGGSIISAFNSSNIAMKKICSDYLQCEI